MLRKILKYIPVFSLWLAGLTLTVHLLLPHDHHITDSLSNQDRNCPASNHKSGHNTGFPVHCHAFNDLASEKATVFVITGNIQSYDLSLKSFTDAFVLDLNASKVKYSNIREPIPDHYLLELSPFRAPPELS